MRRIRVLITNYTLASRTGTETYVRDLALGLLERRHSPVVYSPQLGPLAHELRKATVPVVDRIDELGAAPDIIHGNHSPELMSALLRFPGVPGVFFCHDWSLWASQPPRFPRILRYVAVDDTCRDRLLTENAIPPDRVRVLLNAVDLDRFRPRPPLPPSPRRALVYRGSVDPSYVAQIRAACTRAGITLDVVAGDEAKPELVLPRYDLVFAKARCALEALAVGTAVILCDVAGTGPMVTSCGLDDLRRLNLGRRILRAPVDVDLLSAQIARYDASDAAAVSRRIRETAGQDALVDDMVDLYRDVLDEGAGEGGTGVLPLEEAHAAAAYIDQLGIAAKGQMRVDLALALRGALRRQEPVRKLVLAGRKVRALRHRAASRRPPA